MVMLVVKQKTGKLAWVVLAGVLYETYADIGLVVVVDKWLLEWNMYDEGDESVSEAVVY